MVLYLALHLFVEQNILSARFVALRFALWFLDPIQFRIDGLRAMGFYAKSSLYLRPQLTAACSMHVCVLDTFPSFVLQMRAAVSSFSLFKYLCHPKAALGMSWSMAGPVLGAGWTLSPCPVPALAHRDWGCPISVTGRRCPVSMGHISVTV